MKPWKTLATEGRFTLRQREREYMVLQEGKILMTSRQRVADEQLVRIGCARVATDAPRILLAGLGFGLILRAVLDGVSSAAQVLVNEPSVAVVQWNRGLLASLHGNALEDLRVQVETGELHRSLMAHRGEFDVIVLDLDNGPFPLTVDDEQSVYSLGGLSSLRSSLRSSGRLVVGSLGTQPGFNKRLREVGFTASVEYQGKGDALVFIGDVN